MTIIINNVQDGITAVTQAQTDYRTSLTTTVTASKDYKAAGHARVHQTVASIYEVASALLADEAVLGDVLSHFNIGIRAGQNPFFAPVKAICRKPVKGGGTEFDKSAGKYANSCRYFKDNGWKVDDIPRRLASLKLVIGGKNYGGLRATEAADREEYREDEATVTFEQHAFDHLFEQPGFAIPQGLLFDVEGATDKMFVAAAFSFDAASSEWVLRELLDAKSETVRRAISKKVVATFKVAQDEFFLKVAAANDETDTANSMPPAMKRMLKEQKERRLAEDHPLPAELFEEPSSVTAMDEQPGDTLAVAYG